MTDTSQQMEVWASARMPASAVLSARWRRFRPRVARTLTVGASFVNKVAEVEQGGPGGQVLNEPLKGENAAEQRQSVRQASSVKINAFVIFDQTTADTSRRGGGGISKPPYLVAVDAHMMGGDEGLEDDHPAGVGGALEQRVGHLGDVDVGGVGG